MAQTGYVLEQTGEQVQDILNTATPQTSLEAEVERAQEAESTLQDNIDAEERARQETDAVLQEAIGAEETRAKAAEKQNADDIDDIEEKIPAQASAQNQLADKQFVNQSVATATATFQGTYNLVSDLHLEVGATRAAIAEALAGTISGADNNDYCFVQIPTSTATPTQIAVIERYKFNGTAWAFEYALNNSGFTAEQWAALNSGITSGLVTKLANLPTNAELTTLLNGKQDTISDLSAIRSGAQAGATAYQKPIGGIPSTDFTAELQTALASFITKGVDDLLNYYLKSETYTKAEVQQMIDAVKQFTYVSVAELPTASADTMNKIYLVPSTNPETRNVKDEYITIATTDQGTTTYSWEQIGSTTVDLSGYYTSQQTDAVINAALTAYSTTAQMNAAIASALAPYYTKSEIDTLLGGKQDTISDLSTIRSGAQAGATAVQPAELDAEEIRAKAAEQQNADDIDALEALVPSGASAQNQLADKQFVNSSVATATATFKGSYNEVTDLQLTPAATRADIATALAGTISGADNNDYCFVQIPTAVATPTEIARVERYKYNGSAWAFEYELNNSGFTAEQWAALNSGITSGLVAKLVALPTNAELTTLLNGKQDEINDLNTIRSGAAAGATAYQKPVGGIPTTDMTSGVQSSLQKADNAAPQSTTYTKTEVDGLVSDEETRAKAAEQQNADDIDALEALVPSQASAQNQLADKAFVNSSIGTATATYRGAYNLVTDLSLTITATHEQVAAALANAISTADNNDYCFVQVPAANDTPTVIASVDRYKFDGTAWAFEYTLNNSGFTQAQWDALNSGITSGLVTKLANLPTNAELTTLLNGKQAVIDDLATIRSGAAAGATAYQKPVGGIPSTDMTAELQAALASFITKAVSDLTNYYLKSDTYSKSEVDQLIAAINQFELVSVQTLPTASASTMGKLYFVPSGDPQTSNVKDEYITLSITDQGTTTYYWELIGSTEVNLTNYYTKSQTDDAIDAALATALASYSTTAQMQTVISTAITTALASYSTTAQMQTVISTAITTALANYYTKSEVYTKTEDDAAALNATREKSVISGLTAKTSTSGYAATDLIQLYANDGTPNGKISRNDLMGIFKDLLPGLLSSQSNTTDFLGIDANGLGKTSLATAASLLGVSSKVSKSCTYIGQGDDLNDCIETGFYSYVNGWPTNHKFDNAIVLTIRSTTVRDMIVQLAFNAADGGIAYRVRFENNWYSWKAITLDT